VPPGILILGHLLNWLLKQLTDGAAIIFIGELNSTILAILRATEITEYLEDEGHSDIFYFLFTKITLYFIILCPIVIL